MTLLPPPEPISSVGDNWLFHCPFCPDGDPHGNLSVCISKGVYHCWRCDARGTVNQLRAKTGVEYPQDPDAGLYRPEDREVLTQLLEAAMGFSPLAAPSPGRFSVDYAELGKDCPMSISDEAARRGGLGDAGLLLDPTLLDPIWWGSSNTSTPPWPWGLAVVAARYLAGRGFTPEESRRWGLRVPADQSLRRVDGGATRYGRIVFPAWCPETLAMRSFAARSTIPTAPVRYLSPIAAPSATSLMLSPTALPMASCHLLRRPVLVEGPVDAAACSRADLPAVALCGKHLSMEAAQELRSWGANGAIILLDKEEQRARYDVALVLRQLDIRVVFAALDRSKDPGCAPAEEIRAAVLSAQTPTFAEYVALLTRR